MENVKSQMNMKPKHFQVLWIAVAVILGLSLAGLEFYPLRELAAALIIFGVFFGTIGTALLSLILIQEAALKGVARIEAHLAQRHGHPVLRNPRWN